MKTNTMKPNEILYYYIDVKKGIGTNENKIEAFSLLKSFLDSSTELDVRQTLKFYLKRTKNGLIFHDLYSRERQKEQYDNIVDYVIPMLKKYINTGRIS